MSLFSARFLAANFSTRGLVDSFLKIGRRLNVLAAGTRVTITDDLEGGLDVDFVGCSMRSRSLPNRDWIYWNFAPAIERDVLVTRLASWILLADHWFAENPPIIAYVTDSGFFERHRDELWNEQTSRQGPDGFNREVSSLMWLGPAFWERAGASRQQVLSSPSLNCLETSTGVLRIQAWNQPFTEFAGPQKERYRLLHRLLFPDFVPVERQTS